MSAPKNLPSRSKHKTQRHFRALSDPSPNRYTAVTLAAVAAMLVSTTAGQAQRGRVAPETATGLQSSTLTTARSTMVSAANPLAAKAGRDMLRAGGSAIDAAIATQLVLGLVEPQSSGLGGGAFIVHYDAKTKALKTYDGRETAPQAAKASRFLKPGGKPMGFKTAVNSGLSIGVPGTVRLLAHVHERHGKLPWSDLFQPAIQLATDGFKVSQRLHFLLRWVGREKFTGNARALFFDADGNPRAIGSKLVNEGYANTLRAIAESGDNTFYKGDIAKEILKAATSARTANSDMTADDLASYAVVERPAICAPYRSYKVCGMGPPSSGVIAVLQILRLIEPLPIGTKPKDAMNQQALHVIAEAQKLAYADRNRYIADPDHVSIPTAGLLDADYLTTRQKLISRTKAMPPPPAGQPKGLDQGLFGDDVSLERSGTSHISIIDGDGNTVSMTTTIEGAFGSGHWAAGFLLNNELTDFSFRPTDAKGRPVANRVEGGKRPRSTMAPVIVFDEKDNVFAVVGSPGGSRIILYVTKAVVALIDWKLDALKAAALPNFGSRGQTFEVESGFDAVITGLKMKSLGHRIAPDLMNSGLHVIVNRGNHLEGAADPRREGVALGD
jgi:gamma-glutamyltranspeptidase / glutathione hydrolase